MNEQDKVQEAFIEYYQALFACKEQKKTVMHAIMNRGNRPNEEHLQVLNIEFTREDVRRIMFSISDGKAPGADGFHSKFLKHCWEVVGNDVADAILDFFKTDKLLKVINVTTLALVPKVKCPESVVDFRPIDCSSVLYECITKLLSERLKKILPNVISPS